VTAAAARTGAAVAATVTVAVGAEAALLTAFQHVGDARPGLGVALLIAAFLPYLAAYRWTTGATHLGAVAIPLTLLLYLLPLFHAPTLDDDLWRYRWEGKVLATGHNPYQTPADAPALAPLRDAGWERVAFRHVTTVYPPAAELLFALGYRVGGGTLLPFRLLAIAGHGICLLLLVSLLRARGLPGRGALLYAWNPLIVKEVADSGHVDPWMVAALLGALLLAQRRRLRAAAVALGVAISVKWVPLLTLPLWRRTLGRRTVIAPLVAAALLLPFVGAGRHLFAGLTTYADYWVFNPGVYWGLRGLLDPHLSLTTAKLVAKGVCATAWLAIYLRVARSQGDGVIELTAALFAVIGALLLLAPTLDPWYLTWILPLAPLVAGRLPTACWWYLSAGSCLSYLYYIDQADVPWARWVEYVGFAVLWVWEQRRLAAHRDGGSGP